MCNDRSCHYGCQGRREIMRSGVSDTSVCLLQYCEIKLMIVMITVIIWQW
jgi:hypothetical protein